MTLVRPTRGGAGPYNPPPQARPRPPITSPGSQVSRSSPGPRRSGLLQRPSGSSGYQGLRVWPFKVCGGVRRRSTPAWSPSIFRRLRLRNLRLRRHRLPRRVRRHRRRRRRGTSTSFRPAVTRAQSGREPGPAPRHTTSRPAAGPPAAGPNSERRDSRRRRGQQEPGGRGAEGALGQRGGGKCWETRLQRRGAGGGQGGDTDKKGRLQRGGRGL